MEILDRLQADLDALRELVIELKLTNENTAEEANAFTALVSLVQKQSDAQEQLFDSLYGRSAKLDEVLAIHRERASGAREVEKMIECCTNRVTWRASVNVYCELLEMQIWQETRELLPTIFDELTTKERVRLGEQYERARGFDMEAHERPRRINWEKLWKAVINQAG